MPLGGAGLEEDETRVIAGEIVLAKRPAQVAADQIEGLDYIEALDGNIAKNGIEVGIAYAEYSAGVEDRHIIERFIYEGAENIFEHVAGGPVLHAGRAGRGENGNTVIAGR